MYESLTVSRLRFLWYHKLFANSMWKPGNAAQMEVPETVPSFSFWNWLNTQNIPLSTPFNLISMWSLVKHSGPSQIFKFKVFN